MLRLPSTSNPGRRALAAGWLLNLPALAVLSFFFLLPAAISIWFSLRDWDGVTASTYVGLKNFQELAATERFWNSLRVNIVYAALTLLTQVPLAFLLAVVLFRNGRDTQFLRALVLFPQVLSIGAAALLWLMIYHPQRGLLNEVLSVLVQDKVATAWLGQSSTAMLAVVAAANWYYFGLHTLIFMAGMSGIPQEYYDVLRLGSDRLRDELRWVTLPLLREQFLISFLLVVSGSFGHILGFMTLLTNGGPAGSTELLGLYSIEIGFRAGRFGMASAVTVVLLAVVLSIVIWPIARIARTRLEYS
jgi:raffinose/stachyose/melibiose transport system permease protein